MERFFERGGGQVVERGGREVFPSEKLREAGETSSAVDETGDELF